MKGWATRCLSRVLLVAYTLFLLKPVMPVVGDMLAHAFWKNVHIATVHVENGVAHVHYELAKQAKESDQNKSTTKQRTAAPNTDHLAAAPLSLNASAGYVVYPARQDCFYLRTHEDAERSIVVPPPRWAGATC